MSTNTNTADTTATAASVTANTAEAARITLADTLTKAKTAGLTVITKAFGPDADTASITLATKAAAVMGGADKPRGGAADRINRVIGLMVALTADAVAEDKDPATVLTPAAFAAAARVVLDAHKAAEAARRKADKDERAAAKSVLNDRGRSKADRIAALEVMTEVDARQSTAKADAVRDRVTKALSAARDAGFSPAFILSCMDEAFPGWDDAADTAVNVPAAA